MNTTRVINPFYAARVGTKHVVTKRATVYAKLPQAPRNASPVPRLTSLYHHNEAGPYGDRGYPGNCSGELIKDLLRFYEPESVLDPMTGSGTCRDVCHELEIRCHSFDLKEGFDACDPESFAQVGSYDFCWIHPPYWRMKRYSDDPRDLSTAATLEDFLERYALLIANCARVLSTTGRLAILMGDYFDREAGFVPLVYHTKRLAFAAGLRQACTDIIRFSHGASSGHKVYRSAFIPGLQRPTTEPISIVILTSSGRSSDRRCAGPLVVGRLAPLSNAITSRSRIMCCRHDGSVPPRAG